MTTPSPLAPTSIPDLPPVSGVRLATMNSGLRYKGRDDLLLVELDAGTTVAGALTRSLTRSAPVEQCARALDGGSARALVVNAGNANAFTGKAGELTVNETLRVAAELAGCGTDEVFLASTGVIGQPLPPDAIARSLSTLHDRLDANAWEAASRAILTTDTYRKVGVRRVEIDGMPVTIGGFCKGSGMIAPDMATMLAFVFTDAAITAPALRAMLSEFVERTFNNITVDGDTSTSDTLLLFATGKAGNPIAIDANAASLAAFRVALEDLLRDLARQIIRDGEGATKFVELTVKGAETNAAAKRVAMTIANSPLVKTALAGEDANWGRIVAAIGRAGERALRDLIRVSMGGVLICAEGMEVPGYDEAPVAAHMKGSDIDILVELGIGSGEATVWTCDLTHGYIDINGSYRS